MDKFSDYFDDTSDETVYIDWKEEPAEVLAQLRDQWEDPFPALDDARLDEIVEHYAHESTETFLQALGQELGCLQLRLYALPTDSDEYQLVIIAADDAKAFELSARKHKTKVTAQKQA